MFQDPLQSRAHNGDQTAFREIYSRYSRDVYAVSHTALGSSDSARAVVKQVFLQIYRELMRSEADLDLPARLSALTNEEIRITRIAAGDLDPEALLVQYTIASEPAIDTTHTMARVRAHMQQTAAAQTPAKAPRPETSIAGTNEAAEPERLEVRPDDRPEARLEEAPEEIPAEHFAESFEERFAESFEGPVEDPAETALFEEPPAASGALSDPAADPLASDPSESEPRSPAADAQPSAAAEPVPQPQKKSRSGSIAAGILLLVLLLVFAWLLAGILMDLSILPFYDLGYSLFNEHVFDFFRLP